jgi:hypothetical protein
MWRDHVEKDRATSLSEPEIVRLLEVGDRDVLHHNRRFLEPHQNIVALLGKGQRRQ